MTTPDLALPDPAFYFAIDEDGIEANGSPQLSCGKRGQPAYTADHIRPLTAELERLRAQVAPSLDLLEAVDNVLTLADCECPHTMRFDRGEHMSGCYLFDLNLAYIAAPPAAPAQQAGPSLTVGAMNALLEVAEFLNGEKPLEGVWLGDRHPEKRGGFWWRTNLREAVQALAAQLRAAASNPPAQGVGEPVAYTVAGEVTNWARDFSKYRTQHYVRPVYAAQAPAAEPQWQPIETAPKDGRKLMLAYRNSHDKTRTVLARWVTDEEAAETDADGVGLEGGWYECIDNWDGYSQVAIHQAEPTHWQPLPPAPAA